MRNIDVHNVCTVHVANDFMSSNVNIHCNMTFIHSSAPNHVNDVKCGN